MNSKKDMRRTQITKSFVQKKIKKETQQNQLLKVILPSFLIIA